MITLVFTWTTALDRPGTGDAHRKRNVRYAAKKYFTKGLLPILAGTIVYLGYANGIIWL